MAGHLDPELRLVSAEQRFDPATSEIDEFHGILSQWNQ